jgi:DNA-3-methyladenine glycosylase I
MRRCKWAQSSDIDAAYHDEEWGVISTNDIHLFEMLILEGAQAGLSWNTILKKRANYQKAYYGFDPEKVARFNTKSVERLLNDPGIVRNRLKVEASIINAKLFLQIKNEYGSFSKYIWSFVDGKPILNQWKSLKHIPAETVESQAMSKELKSRGFKFVGPTICYAYMQSIGMVNDHEVDCFKYNALT